MKGLRALMIARRSWTMQFVLLALLVRTLIPAGYMVSPAAMSFTVQLCSGFGQEHMTTRIVVPRSGDSDDRSGEHSPKNQPCAYSALSMASILGADGPLLAPVQAFALDSGALLAASLICARFAYLRPPLRGPPSFA